jgi:phosphoribosylamine-glycine ligase
VGSTLAAARERAYALVDKIDVPDGQVRRDIALRAARGEIVV